MMFATLRWTKTSPGSSPATTLAGTRLSEHPIQKNSGACRAARRVKYPGSCACLLADQSRLRARISLSTGHPLAGGKPAPQPHVIGQTAQVAPRQPGAGYGQEDSVLRHQMAADMRGETRKNLAVFA